MPVFVFLFKYLVGWLLLCAAAVILLTASEAAHSFLSSFFFGTGGKSVSSVKLIAASAASPIFMPSEASKFAALIGPVLALAAILPVCISICFFNFLPNVNEGGDILQTIHFMVLSGVCVTTAIYALGAGYAPRCAVRVAGEFIKLALILAAAFISFGMLFVSLGTEGNIFHLDVFMLSLQLRSLSVFGYAAIAIFVFLALSRLAYWDVREPDSFLSELPLSEYNGSQRAMIQIWTAIIAFLTAVLVTHLFFPWFFLFQDAEVTTLGSFWGGVLGFALFWPTVILVRTFGVIICRKVWGGIEKRMPATASLFLMLLLLAAAMGMIYYEAYSSAILEAN